VKNKKAEGVNGGNQKDKKTSQPGILLLKNSISGVDSDTPREGRERLGDRSALTSEEQAGGDGWGKTIPMDYQCFFRGSVKPVTGIVVLKISSVMESKSGRTERITTT